MANNAKAAIRSAVDNMASDMGATWDGQLNWAATTEALIDLIINVGDRLDQVELATLLGTAAMARRQSMQAPIEGHAYDAESEVIQ